METSGQALPRGDFTSGKAACGSARHVLVGTPVRIKRLAAMLCAASPAAGPQRAQRAKPYSLNTRP